MNKKLAIPFLAAVMAAAQGCIFVGGGNNNPGDVTFSWTFYGRSCSDVGVASVRITIPGESLQNNGVYPCVSNGYPGIVLHDFDEGSYTYTVEGFDSNGYTIYTGSGDFRIDGDVLETVDLTPYGQPGSYALVTWRFPGNVTCANADTPAQQLGGVAYVDIDIDGEVVRANCADGSLANSGQGVYSALVDPGAHTMKLTALTANLYPLFTGTNSLTTLAGAPVANEVALQWAVGGVVVNWTLQSSGGAAQTCLGSGNPYVYVNFVNTDYPTGIYAAPGDANACNAAPTRYFYLPASGQGHDYRIDLTAANNASATWTATTAPVFRVMPGVFPADTASVGIVLKQN